MSSTLVKAENAAKPLTEKQRLKQEKFANKQAQLKQQQQQSTSTNKEKKSKKQDVLIVDSKNWIDQTPAGQRKILKSLDDDFHKAYLPKVVESAWYNYWEHQGLFKPQVENDGSLMPRGKYVIAIPPPNVRSPASCMECPSHLLTSYFR
jgi:valyl-tRNA synthetase